jgi:hypothetical protein
MLPVEVSYLSLAHRRHSGRHRTGRVTYTARPCTNVVAKNGMIHVIDSVLVPHAGDIVQPPSQLAASGNWQAP